MKLKKNMNKILLHTGTWMLLYLFIFFILSVVESYPGIWSTGFSFSLVLTALIPTYLHFLILNQYLFQRLYLKYTLCLFLLITVMALTSYFFFSSIYGTSNNVLQWAVDISVVLILTTAMKVTWNGLSQRLLMQKIRTEKLQTELQMLKGQINPHFYFNTLNNLYSLSLEKSDLVPEGILKLSGLMRYVLNSSRKDRVPLSDEVLYLQDYLSLERLRMEEDQSILFEFEGNLEGKQISPMIFMPFVENCIKHGKTNKKNSSNIKIKLLVQNDRIIFNTENPITTVSGNDQDKHSTKVGLQNVSRRLELLYKNKYTLDIDKGKKIFRVTLVVSL